MKNVFIKAVCTEFRSVSSITKVVFDATTMMISFMKVVWIGERMEDRADPKLRDVLKERGVTSGICTPGILLGNPASEIVFGPSCTTFLLWTSRSKLARKIWYPLHQKNCTRSSTFHSARGVADNLFWSWDIKHSNMWRE